MKGNTVAKQKNLKGITIDTFVVFGDLMYDAGSLFTEGKTLPSAILIQAAWHLVEPERECQETVAEWWREEDEKEAFDNQQKINIPDQKLEVV